jgi:hypothetical protein
MINNEMQVCSDCYRADSRLIYCRSVALSSTHKHLLSYMIGNTEMCLYAVS